MTCADCSRGPRTDTPGAVFLEMAPGRDGAPWWLCSGCWTEGVRAKPKQPTLAAPMPSPKPARRLIA